MTTLLQPSTFIVRDATLREDSGGFFAEVLELARAILNAKTVQEGVERNLFVERILMPLIKEVFVAGGTEIPEDDALRAKCREFFADHRVRVLAIGCEEHCFAQFDETHNMLMLNEDWMERAIAVYTSVTDEQRAMFDAPENYECNVHIIATVDKNLCTH